MAILTKDQAKQACPRLKTKVVSVPELGEGAEIILREMTAADRDLFDAEIYQEKEDGTFRIERIGMKRKMVRYCAVDENGEQLWTREEIGALPNNLVLRLFLAATELNQDADEDGLEEEEKN